jgi:hypothetical protein
MNILKMLMDDIHAADPLGQYRFSEVCIRAWYNPMRYIKGKFYYKPW